MSTNYSSPLLMSDNYTSPLLNSNNPSHLNYSNNHIIIPIHVENDKSDYCCDKTCISCCSFIIFISCVIILIIIHYS
jgi:hypothetical protein